MNRRDFLAAGFKLGAAGLLLPFIEPARKVWALDRTMVPGPVYDVFENKITVGDYAADSHHSTRIYVSDSSLFHEFDIIWVEREPMLVVAKDTQTNSLSVIRNFGVTPQA